MLEIKFRGPGGPTHNVDSCSICMVVVLLWSSVGHDPQKTSEITFGSHILLEHGIRLLLQLKLMVRPSVTKFSKNQLKMYPRIVPPRALTQVSTAKKGVPTDF
jgi:hypothetical protein